MTLLLRDHTEPHCLPAEARHLPPGHPEAEGSHCSLSTSARAAGETLEEITEARVPPLASQLLTMSLKSNFPYIKGSSSFFAK